jgi:hypothetical protein
MKKLITILALAVSVFTSKAQTTNNVVPFDTSVVLTNLTVFGKQSGQWELTFGGGGETVSGENYFGLDFSLSTNPFKSLPEVWVGLSQSIYWEPNLAGSTDLFVDWSQSILPSKLDDSLYLNVGWSGGALYEEMGSPAWRAGPEVTVQFYTSDNSFIFAGTNYDVYRSDGEEGEFRYSFGIGLSF